MAIRGTSALWQGGKAERSTWVWNQDDDVDDDDVVDHDDDDGGGGGDDDAYK